MRSISPAAPAAARGCRRAPPHHPPHARSFPSRARPRPHAAHHTHHGVDRCRTGRRAGGSFRIEEGPRAFYRVQRRSAAKGGWGEGWVKGGGKGEGKNGEIRRAGRNGPGERRRAGGRPVIAAVMYRAICTPGPPAGGLSTPERTHPTLLSDSQFIP